MEKAEKIFFWVCSGLILACIIVGLVSGFHSGLYLTMLSQVLLISSIFVARQERLRKED
ncbi:hypothetical protein [Lewinella sp. W8]|uniref:hypothetical protein n=1 Tax=Lewinella sp. W8 TaxID=2528208 RepID=UPI0012B65AC3|nr:hypothetical protein [Lewinella sp. W8]MTB50296.1 hypothetical protein [Lewinella sp. W8]